MALLLWGLRMVRTGLLRAYGGDLRRFIGYGLRNRLSAFAVGIGVTTLLQSSTATALMAASFAEKRLFTTVPALALVLGADVGTTLVAQVLSFDLNWLSPLLVFVGVVAFMTGSETRRRDVGRAVIGLGLMLLSLHLIVGATAPMRESVVIQDLLASLADERILALLVGAALTWLAHSSLAVILLLMSLADAGLLPLPLALALVLGANLGGAMPAVMATWRGDQAARRLPMGNLAFRLIGVLVALPVIGWIAPLVAAIEADAGRQVVDFHTLFNLVLAALFLPLLGPLSALATRLLPDREVFDDPAKPRYLDPAAVETPALGIAAASRETLRMGDTLEGMLRDTLRVFETDDRRLVEEISKRDDIVDNLHEAIKLYVTRITREALDDADGRRCVEIIAFTTNLEHVGDIIDKNLMELAAKKIKNRLKFSDEGRGEIAALHGQVLNSLKAALGVFISGDLKTARQLIADKDAFRSRERQAAERHLERLRSGRLESIETSSLHLDILRDLKRINSHLSSVAYPILEQAGELRQSRLRKTAQTS